MNSEPFYCADEKSQKNVTDSPPPHPALPHTHPPKLAFIFFPEGDISDLHCFLLFEGRSAGVQGISSQATGHQREEELRKPDSESESALGPLLGQPIADRMDCSGDCSDLGWWLLKNMCLSCPFWCFWSYLLMLEPHGRDSQELGDKSSCFMCS